MLHARWAMLGVVGLVVPDVLGAPLYLLPDLASLPLLTFTIQAVVALGALEMYRGARRLEARLILEGLCSGICGYLRRAAPGSRAGYALRYVGYAVIVCISRQLEYVAHHAVFSMICRQSPATAAVAGGAQETQLSLVVRKKRSCGSTSASGCTCFCARRSSAQ